MDAVIDHIALALIRDAFAAQDRVLFINLAAIAVTLAIDAGAKPSNATA
jgi:hypothetical protein